MQPRTPDFDHADVRRSARVATVDRRSRLWVPDARRSALHAFALVLGLAIATAANAQMPTTIDPLGSAETTKNRLQRAQVDDLARRLLGTPLHGGAIDDLGVLQRLLDERVVAPEDVFVQQSLGVALGDVMARNLRLEWVVVDDAAGRSRALRYRDTPNLFFPVTMISKRVQHGERVSIRSLYDEVAREVVRLEKRRLPAKHPIKLPQRPEPGDADTDG